MNLLAFLCILIIYFLAQYETTKINIICRKMHEQKKRSSPEVEKKTKIIPKLAVSPL